MEMSSYNESEYYANHFQFTSDSNSSLHGMPMIPPSASQPIHNHHFPMTNHYCMATLSGHTSYVSSLALAGKYFYSGSSDGEIRTWKRNPQNYEPDEFENLADNVVAVGKGAVKSLVVLADKLFSAHQDYKIRVWKMNTQEPLNKKCERIATLPTLGDRTIKFLNPNNQVQIRRHKTCTWVHHVDAVSALALSKDESLLYSASWDRTLKIWRTSDFKCLESIAGAHDDAINAIAVSVNGDVLTGSADKKIKVWRRGPGEKKHSLVTTLEKHRSGVNALALSPDGSTLYSGSSDKSILVWEKGSDGNMVVSGQLKGHSKAILCLSVASDLICSGSADKTIRIWRYFRGSFSCLAVLEGHQGPIKCLAMTVYPYSTNNTSSSSNFMVYSGSLDCDVKVWHISVPIY